MDIDHWIKMLELLVSMIQALIWPLLALFVLLYLGTTFKKYLENLGKDRNVSEVSAEAGPAGVKFNVKRTYEKFLKPLHTSIEAQRKLQVFY